MLDKTEHLPDIIRAAAQSYLGVMALCIIALALLAYAFFARSTTRIKVRIFVVLFLGVVAFGVALFHAASTKQIRIPSPTVATSETADMASHGGISNGRTIVPPPACPDGYQPYASRCISQRMADYISCVEASGGNSSIIAEEVTNTVPRAGDVSPSTATVLNREAEQTIRKKLERKWFSGAMRECAKVLGVEQRSTVPSASNIEIVNVTPLGTSPGPLWQSASHRNTFLQVGPREAYWLKEPAFTFWLNIALRNPLPAYVAVNEVRAKVVSRAVSDQLAENYYSTPVANALLELRFRDRSVTAIQADEMFREVGLSDGFYEMFGVRYRPRRFHLRTLEQLRRDNRLEYVSIWAEGVKTAFDVDVKLRQKLSDTNRLASEQVDFGVNSGGALRMRVATTIAQTGQYKIVCEIFTDKGRVSSSAFVIIVHYL